MTAPVLLEVEDLACGYRPGHPVLWGVHLRVTAGRTAAVVGPSGCGKSTLLKTLVGLLPPLAGDGRVLDCPLPAEPAAGRVGYVPQGLGLVTHVSVLRNVLAGLLPQTGALRSLAGRHPREHVERARDALEALGLAGTDGSRPGHLSGGQRRRVAVARALAGRPDLLVADEILSELDEASAESVLVALADLQNRTGTGVLLVEHDVERASGVADVLYCVGGGALLATLDAAPSRAARAREVIARCAARTGP